MKGIRPGVPIIMLTAYAFRDYFAVWCADAYIVKSTDLSELKSAIKRIVKERRQETCNK